MKKGCLITIGVLFLFFVLVIIVSVASSDEGCSTNESKEQVVAANAETKSEQKTKWEYNESVDEMSEKTTFFATLTSDNEVNFDFPYDAAVHCQ